MVNLAEIHRFDNICGNVKVTVKYNSN